MPASVSTSQGGGFWAFGSTPEWALTNNIGTVTVVPNGRSGLTPIIKSISIQAAGSGDVLVEFYNGSTARTIVDPYCIDAGAGGVGVLSFSHHDMTCVGRPGDIIRVTLQGGANVGSFYIDGWFDAVDTQEV
jgi:hypothetical protein